MESSRPSVLLVGDADHHELREAVAWLRAHTELRIADSITQTLELSQAESVIWHTVVFAQPRPGLFTLRDIERVSRALPLAHFVALLGSLCEGETRSGQPWPGVVRIYWHQWQGRAASECTLASEVTSWQLPRTSSEIERTQRALQRPVPLGTGLVAIFTRQAGFFDALAAGCRLAGYSSVWCVSDRYRSCQGATLALWDGAAMDDVQLRRLRRITTQLADVPVIALVGFPRWDHLRCVRALGAVSIVSCPFLLPDLWAAMSEAVQGK